MVKNGFSTLSVFFFLLLLGSRPADAEEVTCQTLLNSLENEALSLVQESKALREQMSELQTNLTDLQSLTENQAIELQDLKEVFQKAEKSNLILKQEQEELSNHLALSKIEADGLLNSLTLLENSVNKKIFVYLIGGLCVGFLGGVLVGSVFF